MESKDFHHPYKPYLIQQDLMSAIYHCIEDGKVGIFESPTGTGKSLSLLCSSLTWLRDHKRAAFVAETSLDIGDEEPEWMRAHVHAAKKRDLFEKRKELNDRLASIREKESAIRRDTGVKANSSKRAKVGVDQSGESDEEFLLNEYESDKEGATRGNHGRDDLSIETRTLLQRLGLALEPDQGGDDAEENEQRIYVCSRTHSQLSQLAGELQRPRFPEAFPAEDADDTEEPSFEHVRQLSLGSRKNLCINKKVNTLGDVSQINERCLELQETKTPQDKRCKFLPSKENEVLSLEFKYHSLSKIRDIEDLAALGSKLGICPYYASRGALKSAEIVMLPYPLLLQKSARDALALSVKDDVVIIDEAHNVIDAVLGMYTSEITLAQLQQGREQLMTYLQKFRNRLAGKNRVYVTQTVRLLDSIRSVLQDRKFEGEGIVEPSALLSGKGVDQINLYKLGEYLQVSKLARKVHGYATRENNGAAHDTFGRTRKDSSQQGREAPVLNAFLNFIIALSNPAAEGRFFYYKTADTSSTKLKYLLLDPSQHFREIVSEARSVILCGGTMSPMSDYFTQLFPYLPPSRITTHSCSHIVPKENLYVSALTTGTASGTLDFSFSSRSAPGTIRCLGETLLHILPLIPDGAVLFFASYSYLDQVVTAWRTTILPEIQNLKPIFIDSRSANTEALLRDYATAISDSSSHRGALLLSVMGGKLSEGINFSDRLGRCVIVVGMPWPNPNGAEWKARMAYIEERAENAAKQSTATDIGDAPSSLGQERRGKGYVKGEASKEFSENVCMRAVNQAIGRVIRHRGDWAAILLLDRRYDRAGVRGKLPGWIRESLQPFGKELGDVEREMKAFYRSRLM